MENKKEYRSAIRSRRLIREAFLTLLQEKELRKITVTDIVKRADINRSTFYAHYPDVRGVIEEFENEIVEETIEVLDKMEYRNIFRNPVPFLQSISRSLEKHQEFYKVLAESSCVESFTEKIKAVCIQHVKNAPDIPQEIREAQFLDIRLSFFIGGILNVYQQWFLGQLDCTLEDISEDIAQIIVKSTADFAETEWMK